MFDLKLQNVAAWISDRGFASVALQLPEGLKVRATEIVDFLSGETGVNCIVLGDPCYGACDLFVRYQDIADALVHFGHSPIPSQGNDENVMYIEAFLTLDIKESLSKVINEIGNNVGLLATVQYIECIEQAKDVLTSAGKNVFVGIGDTRINYPGQVLGCNCSSAYAVAEKVDEFLYIGEGDFHPLAATFGVKKPIRVFNPVTGELRSVDDVRDRILRKRFAMIQSASDAQKFLVIVCDKVGQRRDAVAKDIASKIKESGRTAYIAYMNELSPMNLMAYNVDAYVCTACPRIAMDDSVRYSKPILTPPEAEVAIGARVWDDYIFDEIRP